MLEDVEEASADDATERHQGALGRIESATDLETARGEAKRLGEQARLTTSA